MIERDEPAELGLTEDPDTDRIAIAPMTRERTAGLVFIIPIDF